jgi:predicted cupin superfamily sugar epimerase
MTMTTGSAADLIAQLQLVRHPEGGWYRETYRAAGSMHGHHPGCVFGRSCSTAIYFLLEQGEVSALHRLKSDEMWHFYAGSPLIVHIISPEGGYRALRLGSDLGGGESFQGVVPAGCWFGAEVSEGGEFSLVGCTVAPGFDFDDFEMGERGALLHRYPAHAGLIRRLTKAEETP